MRPSDEIEADLATTRGIYSGALDAVHAAKQAAADLRRRAVAGDPKVSASDLATAAHQLEFVELGIPAKLAAVQALEAELRSAEAHAYADGVIAEVPFLEVAMEERFDDLVAAQDGLVEAWRRHAAAVSDAAQTARQFGYVAASPRIRESYRGVVIDGVTLTPKKVHERLADLHDKTHRRLFATGAND